MGIPLEMVGIDFEKRFHWKLDIKFGLVMDRSIE
jgi:hypothetical protein